MNIQEQARQETAAKRRQEKHLQDTMSSRSQAEVKQTAKSEIEEQAREGEATTRQHENRLRENMSRRSQAEIGDRD